MKAKIQHNFQNRAKTSFDRGEMVLALLTFSGRAEEKQAEVSPYQRRDSSSSHGRPISAQRAEVGAEIGPLLLE